MSDAVLVGIFTEDFTQVFIDAKPMVADARPRSQLMDQPIEIGTLVTDHAIFLPTEIELSLFLTAASIKNTYSQIVQLYQNRTYLLVQLKTAVYENFIISELPHREEPDYFTTVIMALRLRQVLQAGSQVTINPANPTNQNTISRGQQQGQIPGAPPSQSAVSGLGGVS